MFVVRRRRNHHTVDLSDTRYVCLLDIYLQLHTIFAWLVDKEFTSQVPCTYLLLFGEKHRRSICLLLDPFSSVNTAIAFDFD